MKRRGHIKGSFLKAADRVSDFIFDLRFLAFILPFITIAVIFGIMGVYPFGTKTVLTVDLYHQYMPFIYELKAKLLRGRSLFYSWNSGLGTEYYAAFANYCASPLNLIALLFPYKALPVFVAFVTALRAGLASLFMLKFLSFIDGRRYDLVTLCFSAAYALCGWFLTDFWNIMWCDGFVLLPLICTGLLILMKEGRYGLYVISLAVAFISNYYSGYMLCVFLIFFAPVMYFSFVSAGKIRARDAFKAGGRFAAGSAIAGMISSVIVIPTYLILRHSSATGDDFPVDFNPTGSLFDFLGRFLVSANPNIRDGMANVACGTIPVLMIPLFFMASKNTGITLKKKIGFGFMLVFMYLSFTTRTLNFIWHGFHFPNQIPYRQSYMMSFVVLTLGFMTIRVIKTFTSGQLGAVCAGAGVFLVLYEKFGQGNEGYQQIGLSLLFLIAQSLVLRFIVMSKRGRGLTCQIIFAAVMLLESITASAFTICRVAEHEGFTSYDFYGKNRSVIRDHAMAAEGAAGHFAFERTELFPNLICDIQSVYDIKGMSVFSSTARESFVKYMRNFGFHNNGINGIRNAGMTRVTATLLGVRNFAAIQNTQNIPLLFDKSWEAGEVSFYDNPDALPVGFMVSDDILDFAPSYAFGDIFAKTNNWIRAMGVEADVYLPVNAVSSDEAGLNFTGVTGNTLSYTINAAGGQSSYTVTCSEADRGADVYIYADSSKGGRVRINKGGQSSCEYEIRSYQTIFLGKFEGDPLSATITYKDSPSGTLHVYAYELNVPGYEQMAATLSRSPFNVSFYDDTTLNGTIDAGQGGFMLLTVPYAEGFDLTVDGEKAPLISVQDALCGVNLTAGVHEISLRYRPPFFTGSLLISLAGMAALAFVIAIRRIRQKDVPVISKDTVPDEFEE